MHQAEPPESCNSVEATPVRRPGAAFWFLLLTAPIPMLGALTSMVWLPESVVAKGLYMLAKAWLLVSPLVWLRVVEKQAWREVLQPPRWSNRGMRLGHATGLLIGTIILGAYVAVGRAWIDLGPMLDRIQAVGLDRWGLYLALAMYLTFVNALLEEYYWRWFVFSRLRDVMGEGRIVWAAAVGLAGLMFMAHHVVVLKVFFDWRVTALGSVGVFIGGVTWSVIYARCKNIYAAYVSHIWADLAILALGAWLIFG